MRTLIDRLRDPSFRDSKHSLSSIGQEVWYKTCCEAADKLETLQATKDALLAACKAVDTAIVGCRVGEIGPNEMLAAIGRAGIEAAIAKAEQ